MNAAEAALRADKHYRDMVHRIYVQMPDARIPRDENGMPCWGDIEDTQQYAFCEQIALEIVRAAQAYAR